MTDSTTFFELLLCAEAEYLNKISEYSQRPEAQAAIAKIEALTDEDEKRKAYEDLTKALLEGLSREAQKTLTATTQQTQRPTEAHRLNKNI